MGFSSEFKGLIYPDCCKTPHDGEIKKTFKHLRP